MREELWEEKIQEGSNNGSYREEGGILFKRLQSAQTSDNKQEPIQGEFHLNARKKFILRTVKHQPGCSDLFLLGNTDDSLTRSQLA